jgi:hypothetical protein
MKLFSFFAKMFGPKPQAPVTIAEEFMPVVEEQPVVIVPEEQPELKKKKVVKRKPKNPSL